MESRGTIAWDFDDTLADWRAAFHAWMISRGHLPSLALEDSQTYSLNDVWPHLSLAEMLMLIKSFNLTPDFASIPALPDAWAAVEETQRLGWRAVAITAPGTHPDITAMRRRHLEPYGFSEVFVLASSAEKIAVARAAGAILLVDDSPGVLAAAQTLHFPVAIFDRPYNQGFAGPRIRDWTTDLPLLLKAAHAAARLAADKPKRVAARTPGRARLHTQTRRPR